MVNLSILYVAFVTIKFVGAFQPQRRSGPQVQKWPSQPSRGLLQLSQANYDDGEVGEGPNWIEKSFPVGKDEKISTKQVEDYNLGISGEAFQTGPLGKRMFDAIVSRTSLDMSDEIREAFTLYAMDFTAKEATRAALSQNGLEMVLQEEEEDQGMWGDVEAIRLYDESTGIAFNTLYDSLEDAVENWTPGQPFDFVARQVPAKIRELSMDELLQALDPDGALREEAKELKGDEDASPNEEALLSIFDDNNMMTLSDLANDNIRRVEATPTEATIESEAFAGNDSKGYRVIKRSDLLRDSMNRDGTENEKTTMHVMNALVSHGVLLVDLTDGGASFKDALTLSKMWEGTNHFFEAIESNEVASTLPGMATVEEAGSKHAKLGFASTDNGSLQFLETRRERSTGVLLPAEANEILGEENVNGINGAFDIVAQIGKDVVRVATSASSIEHGAFLAPDGSNDADQGIMASMAATRMADELVDDGKPFPASSKVESNEGTISMSPHRLCRYAEGRSDVETASREIFGAHTDSSFVTAVPVAECAGLEVYDDEAEKWYRPELKARAHWEEEQRSRGLDSSSAVDEIDSNTQIPWHCRYVAIMPGEFLQIATRDEVSSAVHRVVASKGGQARLSAPILLRGRSGTKFVIDRYVGGSLGSSILAECEGKTMDEIHDLFQPSYQ